MHVVLFLGPTLEPDAARRAWQGAPGRLEIRPPAAQGDVYAAARESPWAVAVVDGYFEQVPSIWHKEILWALSKGIRVFGASSMGALRAAELEPFGMVGIGRVFELFRDGDLERDDEVAVVHGPPESGYRLFSDALVDIRLNIDAARRGGVVDDDTAADLLAAAASTFYPFRSWQGLLQDAHARGLETEDLQRWSATQYRSFKRDDALRLLRELRVAAEGELTDVRLEGTDSPVPELDPTVPRTSLWRRFVGETERRLAAGSPEADLTAKVVDEMRLRDPQAYGDLRARAQLRYRSLFPQPPPDRRAGRYIRAYRRERGLTTYDAVKRHAASLSLDADTLSDLLRREAAVAVGSWPRPWLDAYLAKLLRLDGRFEAYAARRRRKERALEASQDPSTDGEAVWAEYFVGRLGSEVPQDLELYARRLDFASRDALRRAVEEELRLPASKPENSDERGSEEP